MKESYIYNQNICIYTRVSWLHLTPTKMGLALHCHGELKLANGINGRERDTKRKMKLFPQALALLQALQNVFFVPPKCQRCVSPRENRRKRANLPHQGKLVPGGRVSPPGANEQIVSKASNYRPTVSRSR